MLLSFQCDIQKKNSLKINLYYFIVDALEHSNLQNLSIIYLNYINI